MSINKTKKFDEKSNNEIVDSLKESPFELEENQEEFIADASCEADSSGGILIGTCTPPRTRTRTA
jgi:hypothetical protein